MPRIRIANRLESQVLRARRERAAVSCQPRDGELIAQRVRRPDLGRCEASVRIRDVVNKIFVVAHTEDTARLQDFFKAEGFECDVVRSVPEEEPDSLTSVLKTLVGHRRVWYRCRELKEFVIVVEADFVPVVGFGAQRMPFNVNAKDYFGWLYCGGATLYEFDTDGLALGHSSGMVACLFWSEVAHALIEFADRELAQAKPGEYRIWDSYIGIYLRHEKGIRNALPFRNYGEHGGIARQEHTANSIRAWHQADRLIAPLAYLPQYAGGSRVKYRVIRLRAWLRSVYRLALGRYLPFGYAFRSKNFRRLLSFALRRLLWI